MTRLLTLVLAAIAVMAAPTLAHFPFIIVDEKGRTARLIMSEKLEPDAEVGIGIIGGTRLVVRGADGRESPITLRQAGEWMDMDLPGEGTRVVHGVADLGVMQREGRPAHVLVYYPKAIVGDAFESGVRVGEGAPMELEPVRSGGGFKLRLLIGGKPAAAMPVRVIIPAGDEADFTTDGEGLTPEFAAPGRYGAWARHWVDQAGERDGKSYGQVRRYATLVFDAPRAGAQGWGVAAAGFAMPRPLASFGAAASDGWLYGMAGTPRSGTSIRPRACLGG